MQTMQAAKPAPKISHDLSDGIRISGLTSGATPIPLRAEATAGQADERLPKLDSPCIAQTINKFKGQLAPARYRNHHAVKVANLRLRKCRTSLHRETLTKTKPPTKMNKPINPVVSKEKAALTKKATAPKFAQTAEKRLNLDSLTFL